MSKIVLLGLIFIFLACIFYNKFYKGQNKRELIIFGLLMATCINVGINTNFITHYMKRTQQLYIPVIAILLGMIFITNFKLKKMKPTIDNYLLGIILIFNFTVFGTGHIGNIVKFFDVVMVYICALLIGFLFKFLEGYDYKKVANFFSYIAIANAILSIAQYITSKKLLIGQMNVSIFYKSAGTMVKRVVGFAGTNNAAGNFGVILFAIVFYNYLRTKEKKHLVALILTSIFSILTLTRIGYIGIAIIIFTHLVMFYRECFKVLKQKKVLVFIALVIVVVLAVVFGGKVYNILFLQRGNTQDSRMVQFRDVYHYIVQRNGNGLFGIGAGQFQYYVYYSLKTWSIDIHSQYLNLLTENGWTILFVFLAFNIAVFVRALKRCDTKLEKAVIIGLFFGNLACCNFNPNQDYFINNIMYYFAMYIFMYKSKTKKLIEYS